MNEALTAKSKIECSFTKPGKPDSIYVKNNQVEYNFGKESYFSIDLKSVLKPFDEKASYKAKKISQITVNGENWTIMQFQNDILALCLEEDGKFRHRSFKVYMPIDNSTSTESKFYATAGIYLITFVDNEFHSSNELKEIGAPKEVEFFKDGNSVGLDYKTGAFGLKEKKFSYPTTQN